MWLRLHDRASAITTFLPVDATLATSLARYLVDGEGAFDGIVELVSDNDVRGVLLDTRQPCACVVDATWRVTRVHVHTPNERGELSCHT